MGDPIEMRLPNTQSCNFIDKTSIEGFRGYLDREVSHGHMTEHEATLAMADFIRSELLLKSDVYKQ